MCFKNLPIDFDEDGKMTLRGDPGGFGLSERPHNVGPKPLTETQIKSLLAKNGYIKDVDFDPVTRIAGALAFHAVTDLQDKKVLTANSMATLFRGYEVIMIGRDPRDAIFITSRACGVCGGVHCVTSALALEMAIGVVPPALGIIVRNLMLSIEFNYDHPLHLFLLAGPDYSQAIVEQTNPEIWDKAKSYRAPGREWHGYETMGALMEDLNPLTGKLYLEALHMTRVAREAICLLAGKYPHPETIVPGGVSTTLSLQTFNEFYGRLQKFFDYSKKVVAIWDDIADFFYAANPLYKEVGRREKNMVDTGCWDDPDTYDSTFTNCDKWGEKRWATPGAIIGGELVTTKFTALNAGLEEFVDRSFYDQWEGKQFPTDPLGNPLSPHHPWNKQTLPKPTGQNWKEKYSWSTSPRWDRQTTEAGCYARLWTTAAGQKLRPNPFLESTGHSLKILLPQSRRPEQQLEWRVPEVWNAFERNRGRAYCMAFNTMACMNDWLKALDLLKQGKTEVSTPYEIPKKGRQVGVGFWGAGRGWLTHHMVIENGVVANYQIVTPSTINASPRDPWDNPGPYEEAVLNTPLLETFGGPEDFKGIDILRTIRSFDPCMPCTTHIFAGDRVITREVNTCACGVDEEEHDHKH